MSPRREKMLNSAADLMTKLVVFDLDDNHSLSEVLDHVNGGSG
jgi:hypothetical protein